jgi:hypothetical protein
MTRRIGVPLPVSLIHRLVGHIAKLTIRGLSWAASSRGGAVTSGLVFFLFTVVHVQFIVFTRGCSRGLIASMTGTVSHGVLLFGLDRLTDMSAGRAQLLNWLQAGRQGGNSDFLCVGGPFFNGFGAVENCCRLCGFD